MTPMPPHDGASAHPYIPEREPKPERETLTEAAKMQRIRSRNISLRVLREAEQRRDDFAEAEAKRGIQPEPRIGAQEAREEGCEK